MSSKVSGELIQCAVSLTHLVSNFAPQHTFLFYLFILCSSCKVNLQMLILQDTEE